MFKSRHFEDQELLRNRRELQLINMRKEMVQYLQTGQESIARIRVSWSYSILGIVLTIILEKD